MCASDYRLPWVAGFGAKAVERLNCAAMSSCSAELVGACPHCTETIPELDCFRATLNTQLIKDLINERWNQPDRQVVQSGLRFSVILDQEVSFPFSSGNLGQVSWCAEGGE